MKFIKRIYVLFFEIYNTLVTLQLVCSVTRWQKLWSTSATILILIDQFNSFLNGQTSSSHIFRNAVYFFFRKVIRSKYWIIKITYKHSFRCRVSKEIYFILYIILFCLFIFLHLDNKLLETSIKVLWWTVFWWCKYKGPILSLYTKQSIITWFFNTL